MSTARTHEDTTKGYNGAVCRPHQSLASVRHAGGAGCRCRLPGSRRRCETRAHGAHIDIREHIHHATQEIPTGPVMRSPAQSVCNTNTLNTTYTHDTGRHACPSQPRIYKTYMHSQGESPQRCGGPHSNKVGGAAGEAGAGLHVHACTSLIAHMDMSAYVRAPPPPLQRVRAARLPWLSGACPSRTAAVSPQRPPARTLRKSFPQNARRAARARVRVAAFFSPHNPSCGRPPVRTAQPRPRHASPRVRLRVAAGGGFALASAALSASPPSVASPALRKVSSLSITLK